MEVGGKPLPDSNIKTHKRNSNLSGAKSLLYMRVSGETKPQAIQSVLRKQKQQPATT